MLVFVATWLRLPVSIKPVDSTTTLPLFTPNVISGLKIAHCAWHQFPPIVANNGSGMGAGNTAGNFAVLEFFDAFGISGFFLDLIFGHMIQS